MKKTLLCVLLILLALSLTLAACKKDDVVSIAPESLKLEKGSPVDWNGHVTITVNDKKIENPEITWEKTEGDENKAGICKYVITFVYNEQAYTRDAFVTFTSGAVITAVPGTHTFKIGDEIPWNTLVTVTVDDELQTDPALSATLQSGNDKAEGDCEYKVTYNHKGKDIWTVCKIHYDDHVRMTPAVETINAYVGDEIDWTKCVNVYVDDVLQKNPVLTAKLLSGIPEDEERCVYEVSYVYQNKTFKTEVGVRYRIPAPPAEPVVSVSLKDNNTIFTVGDDWTKALVVTIDYQTVQNPLDYLDIELQDGDPTKEGKCKYKVTFNHDNLKEPIVGEITITFLTNPPDPSDVSALTKLFAKIYDSYTFTYHYYEVGSEKYYIHETDKVMYTNSVNMWEISYEDVNKDTSGDRTDTLDYFFSYKNAEIRVYLQSNDGSWKFRRYEEENESGYARYEPMAFMFADVNNRLSPKWFVKNSETQYSANEVFLQEIAAVLFGVNEGETYTSIVLTTDGNDITSVKAESTTKATVVDQNTGTNKEVTFSSVTELTWSDFDKTVVTLPQATEAEEGGNDNEIPEYVDPSTGVSLTEAQKNALAEALKQTYESITASYNDDKGDMYFRYSGLLKLTPVSSYVAERELGQYKDWISYDETAEYYCLKLTDTLSDVWQIISKKGDFIKHSQAEATLTSFAQQYCLISDFDFSVEMFNYVDGMYILKPEAVSDFISVFNKVIKLDNFTKFDVLSFTVKLDGKNNVTEWRLVADCVQSKDAAGNGGGTFYWDLTHTYSDFDNTAVTLPDGTLSKDAITSDQRTQLDAAIKADYSNVTIVDCVNGTNMYFMGNDVTVIGRIYDENSDRYTMFTDVYKINGDNYYEIVGGIEEAITIAKFEEYVLRFHFELIDLDRVTYDKNKDLYYVSAEYIDEDGFAPYMKGMFGDAVSVTGFAFQVKDGRIVSVTTYYNDGDITATAELSNFGTTTVPKQNPDGGKTEA